MAKLPRVAQKIFAGAAETDQTAVFGTMKTGSAEYTQDIKELMSNPAFLQGWKNAVEESFAPFMEESNGVQKIVTQQLAYILENGIPEWDSETTYYKSSIIKVFSGNNVFLYFSLTDDNTGNAPESSPSNWAQFGSLPEQSGNSGKFLTTDGTNASWGDVNVSIRDYLKTVYPVGSLFFSTASTCPLQSLGIGTWTNVGTSLTLSVNTDVPIKGNGMTLGLTDSQRNGGLSAANIAVTSGTPFYNGIYGNPVGTAGSTYGAAARSLGVTTDPTKSGIVGTVTRTQITVNVFQRTA